MLEALPHIEILDLAIAPYGEVLKLQESIHKKCVREQTHTILIVQHTPVITMGHFADDSDFVIPVETLKRQNVDIFKIERGGKLTAHMPGQIVVYPILALNALNLSTRAYVSILENTVMEVLRSYGLQSSVDKEFPGVWIGQSKIAAVGVRIKDRATMHGLALNVNNELGLFQAIIPCGIQNRTVTTLQNVLQSSVDIKEVQGRLVQTLVSHLQTSATKSGCGLKTTVLETKMGSALT